MEKAGQEKRTSNEKNIMEPEYNGIPKLKRRT